MNKEQTIKVSVKKVYNVCGKNYLQLMAACRRLAKHQLMHEHFEYDEETRTFSRDSKENLDAPYYLKHEMVGVDVFEEFATEEDCWAAEIDQVRRECIYFNYKKWAELKKERTKTIYNEFKSKEVKDN